MQYVLILAETPEDFATRDDPARADAYRDAWMAYAQAIAQAGVLVAGAGLMPPQTATTVRRNGHGVQVEDGPFADTKEQLGGFFVIDVPDLDAALEWAKQAARTPARPRCGRCCRRGGSRMDGAAALARRGGGAPLLRPAGRLPRRPHPRSCRRRGRARRGVPRGARDLAARRGAAQPGSLAADGGPPGARRARARGDARRGGGAGDRPRDRRGRSAGGGGGRHALSRPAAEAALRLRPSGDRPGRRTRR